MKDTEKGELVKILENICKDKCPYRHTLLRGKCWYTEEKSPKCFLEDITEFIEGCDNE